MALSHRQESPSRTWPVASWLLWRVGDGEPLRLHHLCSPVVQAGSHTATRSFLKGVHSSSSLTPQPVRWQLGANAEGAHGPPSRARMLRLCGRWRDSDLKAGRPSLVGLPSTERMLDGPINEVRAATTWPKPNTCTGCNSPKATSMLPRVNHPVHLRPGHRGRGFPAVFGLASGVLGLGVCRRGERRQRWVDGRSRLGCR